MTDTHIWYEKFAKVLLGDTSNVALIWCSFSSAHAFCIICYYLRWNLLLYTFTFTCICNFLYVELAHLVVFIWIYDQISCSNCILCAPHRRPHNDSTCMQGPLSLFFFWRAVWKWAGIWASCSLNSPVGSVKWFGSFKIMVLYL